MQCPVCKTSMAVLEHHNIELDVCLTCRGAWFDAGELELLLESAGASDFHAVLGEMLRSPEARTEEKKRKCPVCGRTMKKTPLDKDGAVIIDICPADDGLWLDHREVDHLARALANRMGGGEKSIGLILDFIGDVLRY